MQGRGLFTSLMGEERRGWYLDRLEEKWLRPQVAKACGWAWLEGSPGGLPASGLSRHRRSLEVGPEGRGFRGVCQG